MSYSTVMRATPVPPSPRLRSPVLPTPTVRPDPIEKGSPETSVRIMTADFTSVDPSSLFPSGRHQDSPPNQNQNENQNHAGNHREHLEKQNQPENQNHHAENRNNHSENKKYCHHEAPDVIVGCCLADLLAPSALMRALLWLLSGTWPRGRVDDGGRSCLVYLPITFAGQTQMSPSAHQARGQPLFRVVIIIHHISVV